MSSSFVHLLSIKKVRGNIFHFYYIPNNDKLLYCTVDDDYRPAIDKNVMEYYPNERWIVLKDFVSNNGIKKKNGKNASIRKVKLLGIRIDHYILNRIVWNFHFNIMDPEYSYSNYIEFLKLKKNKRGYYVRVCRNVKKCHSAIIVSTITGAKIDSYNTFMKVKKKLDIWPRNSKPLIYHLTEDYYYIALKSEKARNFVCYKCITGKYYRNSSLYGLGRYEWKKRLESGTDNLEAE